MILYISAGTSYKIYDEMRQKCFIVEKSFQVQKFNNNVILGLSEFEKVVALSALPSQKNVDVPKRIEESSNTKFICVKNTRGKFRKINRIRDLIKQGKEIIKKERPKFIICDAITLVASYVTLKLGKKFKIPTVGIVTDVPEKYCHGKMGLFGKLDARLMKKYDKYVLLTEAMNEIVNPKNKPYVVMEGACGEVPELTKKDDNKKIILYSGSLWKEKLGLEYFTEGFIKANLKDVELHFYGIGEFETEIEKYSKIVPSIKYMGVVSNSEIIKKQAEATLLVNPRPSSEEYCKYSFPSKTFEYMASGTPVLMTKLPCLTNEYFEHLYFIEEETSDFVCKKLKEIFSISNDERNEFGKKAREFVAFNKNANVQAKKIINLGK